MAHDSNRIYSPNINLVDDLYQFWMVGTRSTGGKYSLVPLVDYLCRNNKINMWARNKPEATGPADRKLTDAERKANNFGLRPPATYTTIADFAGNANGGSLSGWTYDYPKESRGDPFRIGDFDNYRENSLSPFPSFGGGDCLIYTNSQGMNEISFQLAAGYQGVTGNTDYINLNDLNMNGANYSNWYPGLLIMKNASTYWLITSDGTIASSLGISLNAAERVLPAAGAYSCFVFMANQKFKIYHTQTAVGGSTSGGLQIVPLSTSPVSITVVTSAQALVVSAVFQTPRQCVVTVTNLNAQQVVITPVRVESATNDSGDGLTTVSSGTLDAFTVPAGSSSGPGRVSKSYNVRPLLSGFIRLVYKQAIGNQTTSVNLTTPWAAIISQSI